jgi:prepilin-type N-terminal cleavage/methylation domain-containing protein
MIVICPKGSKAFTLIELMVAIAVIAIAAVGALDYQYYAVKHSRIAHAQITATRAAQLLLEDWKSVGGSTGYDPLNLQFGFSSAVVPTGFTMGQSLGSVLNNAIYTITVNNVPMLIMLSWNDIEHDSIAATTLRQLTAMVRWRQGYVLESEGDTLCDSPVILTAYVRLDAGGG